MHSIIGLCRNLGLQVTIEGVERATQLDFLGACGEISVQGFLVARPAEAADVIDVVRRMRAHLESLLGAVERQAAETAMEDLTGPVRVLAGQRR